MSIDKFFDNAIDAYIESKDGKVTQEELFGKDGFLQGLKKRLMERVLQAELTHHVGYKKNAEAPDNIENRRNGTYTKNIKADDAELEIEMPRDREGSFAPQIIKKYQRNIKGFDEKIISMYALGMSTRDIQSHLEEIYGMEVSPQLISEVTDEVMDDVIAWQNRPLDELYPVVFLDCIVVNCRENRQITTKNVFLALAINMNGRKELLGMWIAQNEGAKFWLSVVTELQTRGVKDILIACVDGLKGFPEAIKSVFPQTQVQLCIVHQIRNSLKYVCYKYKKEVASDLKEIYTAVTVEEAEQNLVKFGEKWDKKYPTISKSWHANWSHLTPFFEYSEDIRKVIYTTNAIESLNHSLRKRLKTCSVFPTDESIFKMLYLSVERLSKKWTMPIRDWGLALNQFAIKFEGRIKL